MISDVLADAVSEIDDYLTADSAGNYATDRGLLAAIICVRDDMERLRCMLDMMPDGSRPEARPCPVPYPA